jgi:hypothetical protein
MTPRSLRAVTALMALAIVAAACGSTGSTASPNPSPSGAAAACPATPEPDSAKVSAWAGTQKPSLFPTIIDPGRTLACGKDRMVFSFLDASSVPVADPARTVTVDLFDLGQSTDTPIGTYPATFIWAIEGSVGVYVADVEFPSSGLWGAQFTTALGDAAPEKIRVPFDVAPTRDVVGVGDPAPVTDTPTLADVGGDVHKLSTDATPVEAFYQTSVADALAAKKPFVLVFATPKFCTSQQCGPTLDKVKPIAAAHPSMTFINVEPYQLQEVDGQLQPVLTGDPANLTPAAATEAWRLPSEPWVFVVDGNGIVTSSLMLIFSDEELTKAIEAVQ